MVSVRLARSSRNPVPRALTASPAELQITRIAHCVTLDSTVLRQASRVRTARVRPVTTAPRDPKLPTRPLPVRETSLQLVHPSLNLASPDSTTLSKNRVSAPLARQDTTVTQIKCMKPSLVQKDTTVPSEATERTNVHREPSIISRWDHLSTTAVNRVQEGGIAKIQLRVYHRVGFINKHCRMT